MCATDTTRRRERARSQRTARCGLPLLFLFTSLLLCPLLSFHSILLSLPLFTSLSLFWRWRSVVMHSVGPSSLRALSWMFLCSASAVAAARRITRERQGGETHSLCRREPCAEGGEGTPRGQPRASLSRSPLSLSLSLTHTHTHTHTHTYTHIYTHIHTYIHIHTHTHTHTHMHSPYLERKSTML